MVQIIIEEYLKKQLFIAACINVGQILTGYSLSWTSPVIPKLQNHTQTPLPELITVTEASWIGSSFHVGLIIGPHISGPLSNIIGRKKCLQFGGTLNIIGQIIISLAYNLPMIFAGRVIAGIGIGIIAVGNIVYVGEIASTNIRGIILTSTGIFHSFGGLLIFAIGPYLSFSAISYVFIGLGCFHLLCVMIVPESPIYYIVKGDEESAKKALIDLGRGKDAENELRVMIEDAKKDSGNKSKWKEIFTIRSNIKSLIITAAATIFQQISGILAATDFATTIFQSAGSYIDPSLSTIIIGLTTFVGTLIVPSVIERCGRKTLLLISTGGCCLSMTALGAYFYLDDIGNPTARSIGWLPLASLMLSFFTFSIGLNIVPNTLMGEMYRPNVRGIGSSISITAGLLTGFISITTFGYLVRGVGRHFTFWIFAICNAVGFLFTAFVIPETKGMSLVEIEQMLAK